jgi:hypothetical protein
MVNGMLPYVRFVLGAVLALAVLGAASLGLFASLRLAQQAKVGPLESSRNTPFDDRADWNQFNDPEAARRFEELTRKAALSDAAAERAAQGRAAQDEDPAATTPAPSDAAPPAAVSEPAAAVAAPPTLPNEAGVATDTPPATQTTITQPSKIPDADHSDEPRETGTVAVAPAILAKTPDGKIPDGKASAMTNWDEEPLMVDEDPAPPADQPANAAAARPPAIVPARRPIPHIRAVMRERAPIREAVPRRDEREAPEPARAKPRVAKPAPRRAPPTRDSFGDDFARQTYTPQYTSQPYAPRQSGSQQYAPRQPAYREPYGDYGTRSTRPNGG